MSGEPTRVMSPEINPIPHRNIGTPPKLSINADRMQWRKEVRDWVKNVFACVNGENSCTKGVATCIWIVVYRSFAAGLK